MSVVVRPGGDVDAPALREIRLEALADTPDAYQSTYADASGWNDAQWRDVAARWRFFLAEDDGAVVGLASGGTHEQLPSARWLLGMYVTPSARGGPAAVGLVNAVAAWARSEGATELYLHVTDRVARARSFYDKVGFTPTGEVVSMSRDPSIAVVTMVRALD
ncbi:MAG: GNAT family N-acetyltransferase [Acidimicrobiales bacterium]